MQDAKHGWTALHLAVIAGQVEAAKMLVGAGAGQFMDIQDKSGEGSGLGRRRTCASKTLNPHPKP